MINANNMFDITAIQGGLQSGMQIGKANSPFTSVNMALQDVLGKYNAHLTAQQEQANKLEQIRTQYSLMGENAKNLADYKQRSETTPLPGMEKYDVANPTVVNVGGIPHFVQPIYKNGVIVGKKLQSTRAGSPFDPDPNSEGAGVDPEVEKILQENAALMAQLPQGM